MKKQQPIKYTRMKFHIVDYVLRGGGYGSTDKRPRRSRIRLSAGRGFFDPEDVGPHIGFRIVRSKQ